MAGNFVKDLEGKVGLDFAGKGAEGDSVSVDSFDHDFRRFVGFQWFAMRAASAPATGKVAGFYFQSLTGVRVADLKPSRVHDRRRLKDESLRRLSARAPTHTPAI